MNARNEVEQPPEDIELLLPWHAAGTLSRSDAARVERALAGNDELARRYAVVREELGETIHLNESLGAPSARAMRELFAKIDAEPARRPRSSFGFGAWLTQLVASLQPRTLAYGAAAAAVAIVLQAGVLTGMLVQHNDNTYVSSSAAPTLPGAYVSVRFKPQASAADITKFLADNKASIVNGPIGGDSAAGGMFKLRVSDKALSDQDVRALVKTFAANPVVGFAVAAE